MKLRVGSSQVIAGWPRALSSSELHHESWQSPGVARKADLFADLARLLTIDATDPRAAAREALRHIRFAVGGDSAYLFACEDNTDALVLLANSAPGRADRALPSDTVPMDEVRLAKQVVQTGKSYLIGHAREELGELRGRFEAVNVQSEILSALEVRCRARGVLLVTSAQRDWFSKDDLTFLDAAARWLAITLWPATPRAGLDGESAASRGGAASQHHDLTPREREIAVLVAQGLTNEEIAARLVVVPGTVSNHIEHILRKLGCSRRVQIAVWAVLAGLWSPEEPRSQPNEDAAVERVRSRPL